jgi:hypothetical protein
VLLLVIPAKAGQARNAQDGRRPIPKDERSEQSNDFDLDEL